MGIAHYLKVWLAGARYSIVRTMMFRLDFLMWSLVEFFWMAVNLLLIGVIYQHTDSVAGWNQNEMILLLGSGMILQRLMMGFFWSNLFELSRNIRTGHFDFFIAQPGNPLAMISTRKVDLDGIINTFVAIGVVIYAVRQLGLHPGPGDIALYVALLAIALFIHYAVVLLTVSATFWLIGSQGLEGGYFTIFEFARLPKEAFLRSAVLNGIFVWFLPAVISSNIPARALIGGLDWSHVLWLAAAAAVWFGLAVWVFNRGLRRYSSASS